MSVVTATADKPRMPSFNAQGLLVMGVIYAGLAGSVLLPLAAVFVQSVVADGGMSVEKVHDIFTSPSIIDATINTVVSSAVATVLAAVMGITLAWLVARSNMPFKRMFDPLNMIPFYLSSIVGALSWQVIAAPRTGIANTLLAPIFNGPVFNIYSMWGIAFVLGLFYTPYVYLFTLGSL